MSEQDYVSVYRSSWQSPALSMEALLEQNGFTVVHLRRSARLGGLGSGTRQPPFELFVPAQQAEAARELIAGYKQSRELEPLSDEELAALALEAGGGEEP